VTAPEDGREKDYSEIVHSGRSHGAKYQFLITSGSRKMDKILLCRGSAGVEHLNHDPNIQGSYLATSTGKAKMKIRECFNAVELELLRFLKL
jgi:hypothetical protein